MKSKYSRLKAKLDAVFSKYIRQKYAVGDMVRCYTCSRTLPIKNMQCGHFVSRQYLATRWNEDNCRVQCAGCNVFGNGQLLDFEERLVAEIGRKKVEALKKLRHEIWKLDEKWFEDKIAYYEEKLST